MERVRHPYGIANGTQAQMAVAVSRGDWAAAREACERGLAAGTSDHRLLATAAIVACQTGDMETALSYRTRFFESIAKVPPGPSTEYTMATTMPARMAQIFGLAPDVEVIRRNARAVLEIYDRVAGGRGR